MKVTLYLDIESWMFEIPNYNFNARTLAWEKKDGAKRYKIEVEIGNMNDPDRVTQVVVTKE